MGIVADLVNTSSSLLATASQSQFGTTASAVGGVLEVASYFAIVLVFINGLLQFRPIPIGDAIIVVIKLILISQFATVWGQFNTVADAVISGLDGLAASMLSGSAPGVGVSLASSFDAMLEKLGGSANSTLDSLHMFTRGVMSVMFIGLQALVAASAGLILIFALIMITIHIGLAPLFIGFSIFSVTKDLFFKWVQSTLTYALYPVVIAAVLGSMIRLTEGIVDSLDEDAIGTIAALIPFIVVLVIMTMTILLIPMIVSGLSGAISSAGPLAAFQVASGATRAIRGTPGAGAVGSAAKSGAGVVAGKAKEYGSLAAAGARERTTQMLTAHMNMMDRYKK